MTMKSWMIATVIGSAVGAAALAGAQPAEPAPPPPAAAEPPAGSAGSGSAQPAVPAAPVAPATPPAPDELDRGAPSSAPTAPPPKPRPPDPHVDMPQVLNTPTGWLLPAAVVYSRTGLDTGGGFASDNRVGLGDVAEFGVSTIDQIRAKQQLTDRPDRLQPYFAATFRMGVTEDRLFRGQPGLVLGFRKSFEQSDGSYTSRVAELTLVASRKVGDRAAIHVGAAFWDASLRGPSGMENDLHDRSEHPQLADQVRAFGALEVRPLDRSEIMVALSWAPELCYQCAAEDQIRLRPELAWGVRYEVARWIQLESGVRVPDIGNANLLDAQIFGAVTFVSFGLRHVVDGVE